MEIFTKELSLSVHLRVIHILSFFDIVHIYLIYLLGYLLDCCFRRSEGKKGVGLFPRFVVEFICLTRGVVYLHGAHDLLPANDTGSSFNDLWCTSLAQTQMAAL